MLLKLSRYLLLFLLLLFSTNLSAQTSSSYIKGTVLDAEIKIPLTGANVFIKETQAGAATDASGSFEIAVSQPGSYTLIIRYIGYKEVIKADVVVRPARTTEILVNLYPAIYESAEVVVSDGYFEKTNNSPLSATGFSYEEVRRAPGSAGDVSRIMMSLPSVAKINDQKNSLIVRGGSPVENAFYVDNIEIPNINHFPVQGSSGGPISLINVDFLNDVNFYAGGFSPAYGNRLSSVMEMNFREGSRESSEYQLDLNIAGFGGVGEGPIDNGNGSWMLSLRRSYLDLVIDMFNSGTSVAPVYGDLQWKIVYNLNPENKLSFIGIWGDDHSDSDNKNAEENDMIYFGSQNLFEGTSGVNWKKLWGTSGVSNTSIAYTFNGFDEHFSETGTESPIFKNKTDDHALKLRNTNFFRLRENQSIEFGADLVYQHINFDNYYYPTTDLQGNRVEGAAINKINRSLYAGGYFNYSVYTNKYVTLNLGARGDYYNSTDNFYLLPRISLTYNFNPVLSLSASYGWFSQSLPAVLLSQTDNLEIQKEPKSIHYIAGITFLPSPDVKLSAEIYLKDYDNFPLNDQMPGLFLIDEIFYNDGFFQNSSGFETTGKARSYGIEIMAQKKLAEDFYGLVSAAVFRSKYTGLDGVERNRVFDNRFTFSLDGGWKPNREWEVSGRWIVAGGAPYTPFNISRSSELNQPVIDETRINDSRYPLYHSLNLRIDKRFLFERSNIVLYISIWNVYNRKNVANYYWNTATNSEDTIYQWGMFPLFGVEYEF